MRINLVPLFSYESLLMISLIFISIMVLVIFHRDPIIIFLINLFLIICYFVLSKRNDKGVLLITIIHFSLWGVFIESLIIKQTSILEYRNKSWLFNFPLWLFPAYGIFLLGGIYSYNLCKEIIKFN